MPWMAQVGRRLPGLPRRGARGARRRHRRARVRRPLPRRHRRDGGALARADARGGARAARGARRRDRDAADRGRRLGRRRAGARASACRSGSSRSPRPTPTASRCASAASSPDGARCSCSPGATTARSTRRSSCSRTGARGAREGLVGAAVDPTETTAVVEFNDLPALEAALAGRRDRLRAGRAGAHQHRHRAARSPGFWDGVRAACTRTGTLLIIDETHTLSAGPGGCTAAWDLDPDLVTLGKSIGGGVPIGAYGVSARGRASGWRRTPRATTRTSAASAARSRATRSRSPRPGRRSAAC